MRWWDDDRHPGWLALTWLGALAVAWPLLAHAYPPCSDFPEHAATVAAFVDLQRGGPLAAWYQADFAHTQYWLAALVASWLSPAVGGPIAALRLLLALAVGGQVLAARWLFGALEVDRRWALLAGVMAWTRPLVLGLVPFVLGLPLVLLGFGLVAHPRAARWPRQAALGALALACFYLNLANVVWLVAGGVALAWARRAGAPAGRAVLRSTWGLAALLPPGLHWLLTSDVMHPDATAFRGDFTPRFQAPWRVLAEAPEWLTDQWPDRSGLVLLAAWGALLLAAALPVGARAPGRPTAARALVVATAALWFALPFERGWLWGLNQRFAPSLLVLLPAVFAARATWLRRGVFAGGLALTLASAALAERQARRYQRALDEVVTVLEGLPGARLLQLTFDQQSDVMNDAAFLHVSGYHRVWNGGGNEPSFVDTPQSVLRYRPEKKPWLRPWPWEFEPEKFDNAREGPQYDAVLVLGATGTFPPPPGDGPTWRLARQSGRWRLYAREPLAPPGR